MGKELRKKKNLKDPANMRRVIRLYFESGEDWEKARKFAGLEKKELEEMKASLEFLEMYLSMRHLALYKLDAKQRELALEGSERSLEAQTASIAPAHFDSKTRSALIQAESARNTAETLANALQAADIIEIIANDVGNNPELSDKKAYLAIDSENSQLVEILDDSSQDSDPVKHEGEGGSE